MGEAPASALQRAAAHLEAAVAKQNDWSLSTGARTAHIAALAADALAALSAHDWDSGSVPASERGRALYLRGRALDLTDSADAEECLTRAVKLLPESTDAWNALGSCFWRRNQLASARSAFTAAQSRSSNAVSLRHLSGVTRSLAHAASVAAERQALCAESVAHAKAALALDVTDGSSWYNLGMSTLAELFITGGGVHDALAPVLKAFLQAERCGEGSRNPDLHFNRGVVLRFLEDFQAAADSFTVAGRMDDTLPWRQEVGSLIEDVARVHYLVAAHGRQKPKRIAAAAAAAATTPPPHGLALRTLAALSPGVNPGVALACRIVATASSRGAVPLVHVAVDAAGDCFALSAFGLREGALREGVATTIVAPRLAHARLQAPERALVFPLVRLDGAGGVLCGGVHPTSHSETPQLSTRRPG